MVVSPDHGLYVADDKGINPIDPESSDPYANPNGLYVNHDLKGADEIVFNLNGTILYALSKNSLIGINVTTNRILTNISNFTEENDFSSLEVNPTTGGSMYPILN